MVTLGQHIRTNIVPAFAGLYLLSSPSVGFAAASTGSATLPEKPAADDIATLEKLESESDQNSSTVQLIFSRKPAAIASPAQIEDHGTFIQIVLPRVMVPKPGEFLEGNSPYIKKMAAFQIDATNAAVRLFVNKEASMVKSAMTAEILDARLVATLDHRKLAELISKDPATTASTSGVPTAEQVVQSTAVDHEIPAPSEQLQDSNRATKGLSTYLKPNQSMQSKIVKVAIFCGVMLLGLLVFWLVRPFVRRRKIADYDVAIPKLRSLATHSLSPKQKLELLQIGEEQILIGVTPENINFLTTISPRRAAATSVLTETRVAAPVRPQPKFAPPVNAAQPKPAGPTKAGLPMSNMSGQKSVLERAYPQRKTESPKATVANNSQTAISDVTKMIREKLRQLPAI